MLDQFVEAAIICAVIAGLAYFAGLAIASVVEQQILRKLRAGSLDERLQRLALLAGKLKARRDGMLPALVRLDAQVKSVRRRHYMVQKKVADLSSPRSALIRVIGEEEAFLRPERPSRRFIATVINKHVQRSVLEQKEHPLLSRSWARAQQVHVWAPTIGDAKLLVEKSFPPATGFGVLEISEPADDAELLATLDEAGVTPAAFRAKAR